MLWTRIKEMAKDEDPSVRYQVLHNLCDGSPHNLESEVIPILESMWNDPDKKIRRQVRRVLNSYRRTGKWNVM
jgi:hypothetical protein